MRPTEAVSRRPRTFTAALLYWEGATLLGTSTAAPYSVSRAPATFNITANASDSDGTVSKVDFYQGATL
ncbi:MAG: hypothetical protein E6H54_01005, partial [Betaproteobacteria bacterium]